MMITSEERADRILTAISELVGDLMYYDRVNNSELPLGMIEAAIAEHNPGAAMMAAHFEAQIRARLPEIVLEGTVLEPGEEVPPAEPEAVPLAEE